MFCITTYISAIPKFVHTPHPSSKKKRRDNVNRGKLLKILAKKKVLKWYEMGFGKNVTCFPTIEFKQNKNHQMVT